MNSSDFPIAWFRYVDDTFALFLLLHYLNSRHDNIQFTIEEIPFLDVSAKRQDNNSASQHPFTARKLSKGFILNGTHSHLESTRLTHPKTHLSLSPHLFLILFVAVCLE